MAKNSWVTIEIQEAELRRLRTENAVLRRSNDDLFKTNTKLQAKINRLERRESDLARVNT
jgi:cell division protein FtsB